MALRVSLEVLDSEQNDKFRDHYIELPMDLSEVLFIATANDAHNIPRPLYDRMEIIEVTSYTENEKFHIAKEHLLPKQLEKNGLKAEQMKISDKGLKALIHCYTREAGVRSLERRLGELCRKAARQILENDKKIVKITDTNLEKFLGKPVYSYTLANEQDEVGIVRGLAWTSVGGDTLQIEVNAMPGKGELALTGQLGDVMKESAKAGITYIRSIASQYGVDKEYFEKHDFHIHIPEGAVPKDGPSAGITMATALLSAITAFSTVFLMFRILFHRKAYFRVHTGSYFSFPGAAAVSPAAWLPVLPPYASCRRPSGPSRFSGSFSIF